MVIETETLATVDIFRRGNAFVTLVETQGWKREYRNEIFEDMIREIIIDLQEEFEME
jgi:hypothetical protein